MLQKVPTHGGQCGPVRAQRADRASTCDCDAREGSWPNLARARHQRLHGARHRHVRTSNTLDGLVRLTDAGILHADEYRRLTDGYVFLRAVEHSLQLMNNRREHSLPSDPRELNALARRLDFETANQLMAHFDGHRESIRKIFDKYISHERALTEPVTAIPIPQRQQIPKRELETYESVFSDNERRRHLELLAEVNETQPVRVIAEVATVTARYDPANNKLPTYPAKMAPPSGCPR